MSELVMPRLSDTMEEGTILRWLKADGEQVARGEELVEIETDKATMTYESDQEGFLKIIAVEGSTLAVGEPIASVGPENEGMAADATANADDQPAPEAQQAPSAGGAVSQSSDGKDTAATPAAVGFDAKAEASSPTAPIAAQDGKRVRASPLARRIARERGVELRRINGSGPGDGSSRPTSSARRKPRPPAVTPPPQPPSRRARQLSPTGPCSPTATHRPGQRRRSRPPRGRRPRSS